MRLYSGTSQQFVKDAIRNQIADKLLVGMAKTLTWEMSEVQVHSEVLAEAVNDALRTRATHDAAMKQSDEKFSDMDSRKVVDDEIQISMDSMTDVTSWRQASR